MKSFNCYLLILIIFSLASCRKENTPENQNDTFVPMATDVFLGEAGFMDASRYETSGTAKFYTRTDDQLLRLENFKTDNGPALKVYVAKDIQAADFIDLGNLKAVAGNQNYSIPKNVNLAEYPYVLIWCEQFSVLFGSAKVN
jgi:hypothetical protein